MSRKTGLGLLLLLLLAAGTLLLLRSRNTGLETPAAPTDAPSATDAAAPAPAAPAVASAPIGPAEGGFDGIVRRGGRPTAAVIEIVRTGGALSNFAGIDDPEDWIEAAHAGPDGRWSVRGIPTGKYLIRATDAEGRTTTELTRFTPNSRFPFVDLILPDGDLVFAGRAVWSDGRPFAGRIGAVLEPATGGPHGLRPAVAAGPNGEFRFEGLEPGHVRPEARISGELVVTGPAWGLPRRGEVLFVVDEGLRPLGITVVADEDGRPVAGAEVYVGEYANGPDLGKRRKFQHRAVTDAEGRVRTWYGAGTIHVGAEGFGDGSGRPEEGESEIEIRLARAGAVAGRVVSAATGEPVPAVVWADRESARAAADGTFRIDGVAAGKHTVFVLDDRFASPELRVYGETSLDALRVEVTAGETTEVDRTAEETGTVRGRALSPTGEPAAGATVTLYVAWRIPGGHHSTWWSVHAADDGGIATTGEDGTFEIVGLLPGRRYQLIAWDAAGRKVVNPPFQVAAGVAYEEDVVFPADGGTRAVRVLFEAGEPVIGARLSGPGWGPVYTGPDGAATVGPLLPDKRWLVVDHESLPHRYHENHPLPEGVDPVTIRVPRAHVLGGAVLHPDGRPAAGAYLSVYGQTEGGGDFSIEELTTDADGRFRVPNVPAATKVWLSASYAIERGVYSQVRIQAELDREDHVLRLEPPAAAAAARPQISVVAPDGSPVSRGEGVVWTSFRGMLARARRENVGVSEGKLPAWHLPPAEEQAWVEVYGAGPADAPLGPALLGPLKRGDLEAGVRLRLPPAVAIEGRVIDPGGAPVPAVEITATPLWPALDKLLGPRPPHATATTLAAGGFRLAGLGEIPYRLEVTVPDGFAAPAPFTVEGEKRDLVIHLNRATTAVVTVLVPDGASPAPRIQVNVFRRDGVRVTGGPCGPDGRVELTGLDPEGDYVLRTWTDAARDYFWENVDPWKPRDTEIRLRRAYSVAGTAVTAAGRPAVHVRVACMTADGKSTWRWTKEDGRFQFDYLEAGAVTLKILPREAAPEDEAVPGVTVPAGSNDVRLSVPE